MSFQFDASISPEEKPADSVPEIWNPATAIILCILFSPMFSALIHMYNWRRLNQPGKAGSALMWAIALLLVGIITLALQTPTGWSAVINWGMFGLWYALSGGAQVSYVKREFGTGYTKKGWGTPVAIAILASLAMAIPMVFMVVRNMNAGSYGG